MTDHTLEETAREMLRHLADVPPHPNAREALMRFKARQRRDRLRELTRRFGMAACVAVIVITSLTLVRPSYADFSWQRFISNLGSRVGHLITGQKPDTVLTPQNKPAVDLSAIKDDIPFVPRIPKWLPDGSRLVRASVLPLTPTTSTLVMTFETTDQRGFTIKETNSSITSVGVDSYKAEDASTTMVKLGRVEGALIAFIDKETKVLLFSSNGIRISIEGSLSDEELIRLGTTIIE